MVSAPGLGTTITLIVPGRAAFRTNLPELRKDLFQPE